MKRKNKSTISNSITKITILIFVIFVTSFAYAQMPIQKLEIKFKELGKIKIRKASEIKASNLGIGCEVLDRDFASYDAYKTYLGNLGVKHARFQSGWAKTEKQTGVYNFKWLDNILDDCLSRGIQPWVCICYGNPIYFEAGNEQSSSKIPIGSKALQAWLKYVEKLVIQYKYKVFEWEVWNESDNSGFKGASAEDYAIFYLATANVIRSIQPAAKIFVGGMCSSGVTDYIRTIFNYMKSHGEIKKIDGITFHGYPNNPDITFNENLELVSFVKQYGENIIAMQGETGSPSTNGSSGALSKTEFTELSQAKWDLRRALGFTGNNIPFSLFTLSEFNYSGNKLNTKGKLKIDENLTIVYAKQSYFGYQNLCSLFDTDILSIGRNDELFQSGKTASLYTFRDIETKTPLLAYWKSDDKPNESLATTNTEINIEDYKFKKPVLIDIRTGIVYEIPKSALLNAKVKLPIYDSPLLLCDKIMLVRKGLL